MPRNGRPGSKVTMYAGASEAGVLHATVSRVIKEGLLLVLPRNPGNSLDSLRQHDLPCVLIGHQGIAIHANGGRATRVHYRHCERR